ncbi:DUF3793 family protein [Thermophilibacter immobilis]|uniref:DUF3793 family protein n=1 Tax=Thermophilibacter immobilis TaxID=2779519 RepID=A0A7S7M9P5_9ACTN|nr:DUF3793 family protein [Thermophilibacter immobilis]QOY61198.1 DUF3793 family protein [Thermophilibacter immobilis]
MGKGIEVCLAGLQGAGTLEDALEAEFVDCLVRQAGLVLVGEKPAALFGFRPRSHGAAPDARAARLLSGRLLVAYAKRTKAYGVRIVWLAEREGGPMLLAWRPAQVAGLLDDEAARALMASCGLPTAHAARLVSDLVRRLRAYYAGRGPFPHEVGLILGYPVADVAGFMADGGRGAVACGRWKVYGDPVRARRRFDELGRHERLCKRLYAEGAPMGELLRMGMA